jgi:Glycosyl transferase family 2
VTPPNGPASRPTVSVIVPCYNYGHFLDGCVNSVLAQQGVDVRVLVIDDRSTDESAEVGQSLAELDHRVEFRPHSENMGLIATANEGLEWASEEYVVLLSSDDLLVPGALGRATRIMREHPNVGMVYGRPLVAREGHPPPKPSGGWRGSTIWTGREWIRLRCRSGHNCIASPEAVVRSSVQRAVGGYDPGCFHTSDLNMWLRVAAVADVAHVRGAPQAVYRVHRDSMLRSQEGSLEDLSERWAAFHAFFAACSPGLDRAEELRLTAARTLARQALWRASRAVDRGEADDVAEGLADFALEVYPAARGLREWRGLSLRRRIGSGRSLVFVPFLATGAAHRLSERASYARWRLRGI